MDPTKTPAMHPPPGVSPDFNAPDPLHAVNVFSIVFCLSLCTILLAIQLGTKKLLMHGLLLEDCKFLCPASQRPPAVTDPT